MLSKTQLDAAMYEFFTGPLDRSWQSRHRGGVVNVKRCGKNYEVIAEEIPARLPSTRYWLATVNPTGEIIGGACLGPNARRKHIDRV